jgi:LmbE family N-acetylglucosaminyl deacetylase
MNGLGKKILAVSPHPDDETLGGGGTLIRAIREEHEVYWLNITTAKGNAKFSNSVIEKREYQLRAIENFYKFVGVYHLNMPTTELEKVDSATAIDMIANVFKEVKPETVILPDYNDAHSDHKYVFDWCYACTKVFRFPSIKQVMTMEIISETDFGRPVNPFVPNCFVDISDYIEDKIEALKIYDTELGIHPFPRSVENVKALATVRGATAGVRYAEAFRIIKLII